MINPIGDNVHTNIPAHPIRTPLRRTVQSNITKYSGNVLYCILQICWLIINVSFNVICNPIVWFLIKTSFNLITELFVYLVLGICSFLINVITHLDDYYTKGRSQMTKVHDQHYVTGTSRDGMQVQNCTVKRFVETPSYNF